MSLADRFTAWRNRLVSDPKFQAWAVRNPLTRSLARRKAKTSFDLVAGFVYSQVLLAVVELRLLEIVRTAPLGTLKISERCGLPHEGALRLLRAAAALDLVREQSDGLFALGEAGAALLGNPSVFAMVRHHKAFYRDIADPLALLRTRRTDTELSRFWDYNASATEQDAEAYSALMAETQALIARDVLEAYNFSRHRSVMDVGGGLGAFLSAVGAAHPTLGLTLVDLPPVAKLAEASFAGGALQDRIQIAPRDMLREPLPEGADLVTLVRVVHDHDDRAVRLLLSSIRRALAPGGRLLIAEPMAGFKGAEAMADAYFGLYLWAMGRGAPRRPEQLEALLNEAGFRDVRILRTAQPLLVSAILAS
ncbi:methyltransferase [Hyphomonas sp.]|uniref:methyltransferase n=1 Tax=Hyphomonas sp. TaxID=87 RepID=UPI0025C04206|nr:methyltransferase [Hyphomonas sp.]MBI1400622.1 methyltransferase [Hyphomonas sp.]